MPHSRHQALHAISIIAAAVIAWALPVLALLGYDETYHTNMGLYLRIGGAIACIFWINIGLYKVGGPLRKIAAAAVVAWSLLAALFLLLGAVFAITTLLGVLQGLFVGPGLAFLALYAAVGIGLAAFVNDG